MHEELVKNKYNEVINNFKSSYNIDYKFICDDLISIFNKTINPTEVVNNIVSKYIDSLNNISKLSPGFSTSLYDIKENICIDTYGGYTSDISNVPIDKNTLFDMSSVTKLFTSLLLLSEEEKGNIDLDKKINDISKIINLNIKIIDSLKFKYELRTNGRLDDNTINKEERLKRLLSTYIYDNNTFKYSDIPYLLVPLLYGNNIYDASYIYIGKFNDFYKGIGLYNTGYYYENMTGGINKEVFDPKASLLLQDKTIIPAHAGITTNVNDIKKLFNNLYNGLLSQEAISRLITPINCDKKIVNRAMSVYINLLDKDLCDIIPGLSDNAFSSAGSTGTYSAFDLDNGINITILSNIKSTNHSKIINTGNYIYGDIDNYIEKNKDVTIIGGKHNIEDGRIVDNNKKMSFVYSTVYFKDECLNTLLELRIAKKVLNELYKEINFDELFNKEINTNNYNNKKLLLK